MTAFRFIFPDDDEGFELLEEAPTETIAEDEGDDESAEPKEDVIWETED